MAVDDNFQMRVSGLTVIYSVTRTAVSDTTDIQFLICTDPMYQWRHIYMTMMNMLLVVSVGEPIPPYTSFMSAFFTSSSLYFVM